MDSNDCKEYLKQLYKHERKVWKRTRKIKDKTTGWQYRTFTNGETTVVITTDADDIHIETRPAGIASPQDEAIMKRLIKAAEAIKHCGDYGQLYYHPDTKEAHWTAGDADNPMGIDKILKIEGVRKVHVEAEYSPDTDDGWIYLGRHGQEGDWPDE